MIYNNCKDKHCKEYIVNNPYKSSYLIKRLIEMFNIIIEVGKIKQFYSIMLKTNIYYLFINYYIFQK